MGFINISIICFVNFFRSIIKFLVGKAQQRFSAQRIQTEVLAPVRSSISEQPESKLHKLFSTRAQLFQNKAIRQFNYPPHVNNPLNRLYFCFIIFAAIEKSLKTASAAERKKGANGRKRTESIQ
jgi:hypothetical protein